MLKVKEKSEINKKVIARIKLKNKGYTWSINRINKNKFYKRKARKLRFNTSIRKQKILRINVKFKNFWSPPLFVTIQA